jgi:hypothetical protein
MTLRIERRSGSNTFIFKYFLLGHWARDCRGGSSGGRFSDRRRYCDPPSPPSLSYVVSPASLKKMTGAALKSSVTVRCATECSLSSCICTSFWGSQTCRAICLVTTINRMLSPESDCCPPPPTAVNLNHAGRKERRESRAFGSCLFLSVSRSP